MVSAQEIEERTRFIKTKLARIAGEHFNCGPTTFVTDDPATKAAIYKESSKYPIYTTLFHHGQEMLDLNYYILQMMKPGSKVIDVGCSSGLTGLLYAHFGFDVILHDFEGVSLDIVRKYMETTAPRGKVEIITYGSQLPDDIDWVLSFDTMEHTGNHLGFLRWIEAMASRRAITYPKTIKYEPPFVPSGIDEWIDDERVLQLLETNSNILYNEHRNGRRLLIFESLAPVC